MVVIPNKTQEEVKGKLYLEGYGLYTLDSLLSFWKKRNHDFAVNVLQSNQGISYKEALSWCEEMIEDRPIICLTPSDLDVPIPGKSGTSSCEIEITRNGASWLLTVGSPSQYSYEYFDDFLEAATQALEKQEGYFSQ